MVYNLLGWTLFIQYNSFKIHLKLLRVALIRSPFLLDGCRDSSELRPALGLRISQPVQMTLFS